MPRTKRPVRKQEKSTEDDDTLKKLNKLGKLSYNTKSFLLLTPTIHDKTTPCFRKTIVYKVWHNFIAVWSRQQMIILTILHHYIRVNCFLNFLRPFPSAIIIITKNQQKCLLILVTIISSDRPEEQNRFPGSHGASERGARFQDTPRIY